MKRPKLFQSSCSGQQEVAIRCMNDDSMEKLNVKRLFSMPYAIERIMHICKRELVGSKGLAYCIGWEGGSNVHNVF